MSKSIEHPEDHAHATSGGQGNPSLAIPQAVDDLWEHHGIICAFAAQPPLRSDNNGKTWKWEGRTATKAFNALKALGVVRVDSLFGGGFLRAWPTADLMELATAVIAMHQEWMDWPKARGDGTGGDPSPPQAADEIPGTTP